MKCILNKLTQSQQLCQSLAKTYEDKLEKSRLIIEKLKVLVKKACSPLETRNNFLAILSLKLESFSELPLLSNRLNFLSNNASTVNIDDIFTKSDDSILAQNNFEISLENALSQFVMWGFFTQEN